MAKQKKQRTLFAKQSSAGFQHVPVAGTASTREVRPTKIKTYKVPQTSTFKKLK